MRSRIAKNFIAFLAALSLSLAGCQGNDPAAISPEGNASSFEQKAIALKATAHGAEYERAFLDLKARYGLSTSSKPWLPTYSSVDMEEKPGVGAARPLAKSAQSAVLVLEQLDSTLEYTHRSKILVQPGNTVTISAKRHIENWNASADPIIALIQFESEYFKANGTIPFNGMAPFKIIAFEDDSFIEPNHRDAVLTWTKPSEGPAQWYYYVILPYSSQSRGLVKVGYGQSNPTGCPGNSGCQDFAETSNISLTGTVFREAGDRFETAMALNDADADPVLIAFRNSSMDGIYCDDTPGSRHSLIHNPPFALTGAGYDMVLETVYNSTPARQAATYRQYRP